MFNHLTKPASIVKHEHFEDGFCTGKHTNQNALFCARVAYFWPKVSIKIFNFKTFEHLELKQVVTTR